MRYKFTIISSWRLWSRLAFTVDILSFSFFPGRMGLQTDSATGGSHLMTPMVRLCQVGETTFNVVPPYEVVSPGLHIMEGR